MAGADPESLEGLLDELNNVAQRKASVTVADIYDALGDRSFGPLLLVTGLLGMSPVSGIPTAPTILAFITLLIAGQLALGRETLWLPNAVLKLKVDGDRFRKSLKLMARPARVVGRVVRPRLQMLTVARADRFAACVVMVVALCVPPLELLPFVAFIPACAIAAFGLGLIARDGLLVAVALAVCTGAIGLIAWRVLA